MIRRYPLGYLVLWSAFLAADHGRIDRYFVLFDKMQIYLRIVQQQLGPKASAPCHDTFYDNAVIGTQSVSDFVSRCINVSSRSTVGGATSVNATLGLVVATYSLLQGFAQIWHNKKERSNAVQQMQYADMMVQFPHLVLIEYQIKIMELLIEMCCFGTTAEQVFGRIHLVSMMLSGPYERYTKKQAKKLYKNYFDSTGRLVSLERFVDKYPYHKFDCKVSTDWQQLVLQAHKYSTTFTLFFRSPFACLAHNDYNQTLLGIVDAGMHHDLDRIEKLCQNYDDPIILQLRSFYF